MSTAKRTAMVFHIARSQMRGPRALSPISRIRIAASNWHTYKARLQVTFHADTFTLANSHGRNTLLPATSGHPTPGHPETGPSEPFKLYRPKAGPPPSRLPSRRPLGRRSLPAGAGQLRQVAAPARGPELASPRARVPAGASFWHMIRVPAPGRRPARTAWAAGRGCPPSGSGFKRLFQAPAGRADAG